jgi:hypothetical protein
LTRVDGEEVGEALGAELGWFERLVGDDPLVGLFEGHWLDYRGQSLGTIFGLLPGEAETLAA